MAAMLPVEAAGGAAETCLCPDAIENWAVPPESEPARIEPLPQTLGSFALEELEPERREIVADYLEELREIIELRSEDGHIAFDGWTYHYPSMLAMNELSAYLVSGDETFLDLAIAQLDFSLTLENEDGIYVSLANDPENSWIGRDSLSRHILSLYVGYRITGDVKYLEHAETNAAMAIEKLARFSSSATNDYVIFYSQYDPVTYTPWHAQSFLNPNQDSALGAAFLLLYHDSRSALYQNGEVADIARSQLESTMSIQLDTGEIPVVGAVSPAPISTCYDTGYGAYTLWSWAIAQHLEKNPVYEDHLQRGVEWIAQYSQQPQPVEQWCYTVPNPNPTPEEHTTENIGLEGYLDRYLAFVVTGEIPEGYEETYFQLLADFSSDTEEKIGRQFSLAMAAVLGYDWSEFRLGVGLEEAAASDNLKELVAEDGTVYSLDADGWLHVNGTPVWSHTHDFSLADDGTLWWLGTSGDFYQRLPGEAWQALGSNVARFAVQDDGPVYSLTTDCWLHVDGAAVWSDTRDFSIADDGTLWWLGTSGEFYRRPPGQAWEELGSNVAHYVAQDAGPFYWLTTDGWLHVGGAAVWSNTRDFSVADDGTLRWLGTSGELYQQLVNGAWRNIGEEVVEYATRADGIVLALAADGEVTIDGAPAWTDVVDLRLSVTGLLEVDRVDGDVFLLLGRYDLSGTGC